MDFPNVDMVFLKQLIEKKEKSLNFGIFSFTVVFFTYVFFAIVPVPIIVYGRSYLI